MIRIFRFELFGSIQESIHKAEFLQFLQKCSVINDQQVKMEILFDVEIPMLIDNSFSVLKHDSYAGGYHACMDIWKQLMGDDSLRCKQEEITYTTKMP